MVGMDDKDDIVNGTILMRKGENPSRRAGGCEKQDRGTEQEHPPERRRAGSLLRSRLADRQHSADGLQESGRGRVAGLPWCCSCFSAAFRPAAIVAVIIPLALLATFIGLRLKGIPANLLSLGAMDFGIIVDGAVIVVENIFRRVSHERGHRLVQGTVAEAAPRLDGRRSFRC